MRNASRPTRSKRRQTPSAVDESKRTDDTLQITDEYIRALMENALDGIVVLNGDGTVRYESPFMKRVLGRGSGERAGKSAFEFIHPDDLPRVSSLFAELLENPGSAMREELRVLREDGSACYLEIVGQNLLDSPAVRGIVANLRDVTERKLAEEELREIERLYHGITENVTDVIWTMDMNLNFTHISPSTERLIGYTPEEEMAIGLAGIMTPESLEVAFKVYERALAGESGTDQRKTFGSMTADLDHVHKDGHIVPTEVRMVFLRDSEGKPDGIMGITRDTTQRRQADQELRESEERYRTILEDIEDGYYEVDTAGNFTFFNDPMCRMIGYSRDEMMGMNNRQYMDEENTKRAYEAFNRVFSTGTSAKEFGWELTRKDGKKTFIEASVSLKRNPEGEPTGFRGIVRDITERKKAEGALRRQEEYFRSLTENALDTIVVLGSDGTIRYRSSSYYRVLGYDPADRAGAGLLDQIHPDDAANVSEAFARMLQTPGGTLSAQIRARHKDGSWRHIEAVGRNLLDDPAVQSIVVNMRDITDRKQAEEELKKSEDKLKRYLESSPDIICVVDLQGIILYVNKATEELTDYKREELVGKSFTALNLLTPESQSKPKEWTYRGGAEKPTRSHEVEILRKGGKRVILDIATYPMGQGWNAEIIAIGRDVTGQRAMEKQKQKMEQQVLLSGRLAAVGELAAGVAHELNNPLAAVQGYAQFLTSRDDLEETVRSDVEIIYKEAKRASRITANLLQFARKHDPEKKMISINRVVEDSIELNAYRLKVNNIQIAQELDPALPETAGDFYQLQQVFVNLMTNAEQAMTRAHGKGKLTIKTQGSGATIQVAFTDDGPGIEKETLKQVFDPFFTTKEVGQGTGLGLSICFGIVEQHGGTIGAKSKLGKGATFTVELPIVSVDQAIAGQAGPVPTK